MYIGDGAKIVRDAFALAREKSPAIILYKKGEKKKRISKSKHLEKQKNYFFLTLKIKNYTIILKFYFYIKLNILFFFKNSIYKFLSIDELDAIGTKRFNNDKDGDREV
jgi:ATP-dependent 26S proteasome regulatory subunit